jgi:hypothetical protein
VRLPLRFATGDVMAEGDVVRVATRQNRAGTVFVHGVQFTGMPVEARDAIELHCAHHSVPSWRARYRQSMPVFAHAFERLSDLRIGQRRRVQLPALVAAVAADGTDADVGLGMIEEMSDAGARLVLGAPVEPGTRVSYSVPGTDIAGSGTVVFNRAFESLTNLRFAVGVRREREPSEPMWKRPWAWAFHRGVSGAEKTA